MRKALSVVLALVCSMGGCSWIFQEHMQGGYMAHRSDSEPRCSESGGWPALDLVFAAIGVLEIAAGVTAPSTAADGTDNGSERATLIGGGVLDVLIHGASAATGFGWASECRRAYRDWRGDQQRVGISGDQEDERRQLAAQFGITNPTNDPAKTWAFWCGRDGTCYGDVGQCSGDCEARRDVWCGVANRQYLCGVDRDACTTLIEHTIDGNAGICVERHASLKPPANAPQVAKAKHVEVKPPPAVTPRGFYCTSNTAIGSCAREKAVCEAARSAMLAAAPDLSDCTLTESAWCFDSGKRCAPTESACGAQRAAAAWTGDACVEGK